MLPVDLSVVDQYFAHHQTLRIADNDPASAPARAQVMAFLDNWYQYQPNHEKRFFLDYPLRDHRTGAILRQAGESITVDEFFRNEVQIGNTLHDNPGFSIVDGNANIRDAMLRAFQYANHLAPDGDMTANGGTLRLMRSAMTSPTLDPIAGLTQESAPMDAILRPGSDEYMVAMMTARSIIEHHSASSVDRNENPKADVDGVDMWDGQLTENDIKAFQHAVGLKEDGRIGRNTLAALQLAQGEIEAGHGLNKDVTDNIAVTLTRQGRHGH